MMPTPHEWEDMSDYVVHFTKVTPGEERTRTAFEIELDADYESMLLILGNGVILAKNPFGVAYAAAPDIDTQKCACFSEIPPGHWQRLIDRRRTKYGIAFHKQFIVERGGGPIWYAYKDTPHLDAVRCLMSKAAGDPSAEIWNLTPYIEAPGDYPVPRGGTAPRRFEWEREWRHVGNFRFTPENVAFLLIPEELHSKAHGFFSNAQAMNLGPAYFCPYVDPSWERTRILHTVGRTREEARSA
jgi:hypothetical protein